MKKLSISVLLLSFFATAWPAGVAAAKRNTPPDTVSTREGTALDTLGAQRPAWTADLGTRLSASQAGYHNWTKGGINTLAFSTRLNGKLNRTSPAWQQKYEINLAFGLVKQDTLAFRKADDLLLLNAALQYQGDGLFRQLEPTLAFQLRSQFASGFNYKKNPFGDARTLPVKVSDFFAPAAFTQSLGLTYEQVEGFTQRLGFGAKETVVMIEAFRPLYNLAPDEAVRFELGAEAQTKLDRELIDNVQLESTLGMFFAFDEPDWPDVVWESLVAMKVNRWLGVNFEVDLFYDRDVSTRVQLKRVLSVGLSVDLV